MILLNKFIIVYHIRHPIGLTITGPKWDIRAANNHPRLNEKRKNIYTFYYVKTARARFIPDVHWRAWDTTHFTIIVDFRSLPYGFEIFIKTRDSLCILGNSIFDKKIKEYNILYNEYSNFTI